jgi:hypothetical protein
MKKQVWAAALSVLVCLPGGVSADIWDPFDNGTGTDNELAAGAEQNHDLTATTPGSVADQDWFRIGQQPYSSYEVIADSLTEEVSFIPVGGSSTGQDALQVELVNGSGVIQVNESTFTGVGSARSLRFRNASGTEVINEYIRIRSGTGGCNTNCTGAARYRVQLRETTLIAPRFNNQNGQFTVVLLQNAGRDTISASVRYWSTTGTLLGSSNVTIVSKGLAVISTQGVVPDLAGSVTVDHTGRYGALSGKSVALEPATGFTFDTTFFPRVN